MERGGNNWNDNGSISPSNEEEGANRPNGHSADTTTIASSSVQSKESELLVTDKKNDDDNHNGTPQDHHQFVDQMLQKEALLLEDGVESTSSNHHFEQDMLQKDQLVRQSAGTAGIGSTSSNHHFEQDMLQKDQLVRQNATTVPGAVLQQGLDPYQRHMMPNNQQEPQQQQQQQQQPEEEGEEMIPGAYAIAPPGWRQDNPPPETVDMDQQAAAEGINQPDNNEEGLAVANLVADDGHQNRPLADPVDLAALEQLQAKQKKQQRTFLLILALVVLAGGTIIGTVAGTASNQDQGPNQVTTPTEAPTAYDYGSMEPSSVPSSAPTGILDYLFTNLPNDTLASLQEFGTPQWKAWDWLSNHQNITFLPEWRKMQLFALTTFFFSFEGEKWSPLIQERWLDDTLDECLWFSSGFGLFQGGEYVARDSPLQTPSCNHLGQFTSLLLDDLALIDMTPVLPPEIELLTSLKIVGLRVSDIAGSWSQVFPSALYKMTQLAALDLTANALTGSLPTELGQLTNLVMFNVVQNQLTGPLLSELGLLTALTHLDLGLTLSTGSIPSEVGELTALRNLHVYGCPVQGQIPSESGQLKALEALFLIANQLSNQIPSEIGELEVLTNLGLYQNQLSGQVPSQFGRMAALEALSLDSNLLSLLLPTELWSMSNLTGLGISNNAITGTLASEMGLLTALQQVDLSNNQLQGTVPSEIGLMVSLEKFNLFNNSLTGTLPSQLNESMGLRLDGNQFSGTVPDHLCAVFWCDCSADEISVSSCADLGSLAWPGRFPPASNDGSSNVTTVVFNFQTDDYPADNYWVWQQQESNISDVWTTLQDSGGALLLSRYLYSYMLALSPNSSYQLLISDAYGDGILYGSPGWITLIAPNHAVLYSFTNETQFTELTVSLAVGVDGQVEATGDIYCDPQYEQCRFGWGEADGGR